ncbi:CHRD domain-containing protein [Deinococcus yavapaiensis]|uniref:CHRD domain-containing protein n=1 Tax=Deinococcus yavapaiensis KR-236 TaxID=694435 RepID=A0A318S4X7_9DEIO|nr:CHRD domain-containing protein [Deinococcus yavapaiensis]PYE50523.1 CHRD domain-containing protein [Deinococcus yavapaiensis KR-236]
MNAGKLGLTLVMTALLGSCMMTPRSLAFRHNPVPADAAANGTAVVTTDLYGAVTTTLTLSGLTPNKAYAAHYHAFGPASSTDPCASNGPVSVGFPPFTADAMGNARVSVTSELAKITGDAGAYINVHFADDLTVIPLCAPIKTSKG